MSNTIVIVGTDTDVGKTVFAAALTAALGAHYWKPVQAGLHSPTDSERVRDLGALPADRIVAERYALTTPASPHRAAAIDGLMIDVAALQLPDISGPLVVEAAGGLLVPLTPSTLQIDVIQSWHAPIILCARTRLGTINHSLLSIEALKQRGIAIMGIAFIGEANIDSERTICDLGGVTRLGRLPQLDPLNATSLSTAFAENFDVSALRQMWGRGS